MLIGICGGEYKLLQIDKHTAKANPNTRHLRRQIINPTIPDRNPRLHTPQNRPHSQHAVRRKIRLRRPRALITRRHHHQHDTANLRNSRSPPRLRHPKLATKLRHNLHRQRTHRRRPLPPAPLRPNPRRQPHKSPLATLPLAMRSRLPPPTNPRTVRDPK